MKCHRDSEDQSGKYWKIKTHVCSCLNRKQSFYGAEISKHAVHFHSKWSSLPCIRIQGNPSASNCLHYLPCFQWPHPPNLLPLWNFSTCCVVITCNWNGLNHIFMSLIYRKQPLLFFRLLPVQSRHSRSISPRFTQPSYFI